MDSVQWIYVYGITYGKTIFFFGGGGRGGGFVVCVFRGGGKKKSTFSVPFPRRNTFLEEGRLISQIFVGCKHSIVFVSCDGSAAEIHVMYETNN